LILLGNLIDFAAQSNLFCTPIVAFRQRDGGGWAAQKGLGDSAVKAVGHCSG